VTNWADEFPLVSPPPDNPVRADASGMGDEFVVKLKSANTPGAATQFLSRTGVWVNFASTDLNAWGSIIGDLQNQQDLWDELQARPLSSAISTVGFTGQYADLLNKPLLGDLAFINTNGLTSYFLRGDGTWQIPVDVNAVWGNIGGDINAQTDLIALLALKAPLANPLFTGLVRAPNPAVDDSSTTVATTAWFFGQASNNPPVMAGVASSGDSTLWARGNHRHPTDTTRAPLASPAFTGTPSAPTPGPADNSDRLATTAFVKSVASLPDAPQDGGYYVRRNGAWVALELGTRWDGDGLP
jgi:hypothetical protein